MLLAGAGIALARPAAAAPELPTLTITNVRADRPVFEPASRIADARLSNPTGTSFWFIGISGPKNPLRQMSIDHGPWRATHVCLTGARAYELPPGAEVTFPVHADEGALVSLRIPAGFSPNSTLERMITSPETRFRKGTPPLAMALALLLPVLGGFVYFTRLAPR